MLSLLAALILVVAVLPSALRPPPDETNASELSPDAPPEEDPEAIIQSLRQAASRTAGATGEESTDGVAAPTTTTTTAPPAPSRGQCYGDPPRQAESFYAPPCRPAFVGDNGGSTYPNVTGDTVRVAFWHTLGMPAERGPVADSPPPGETNEHRTARVLQAYFNEHYELYGRRVQLVAVRNNSDGEAQQRASAVQMVTQDGVFAATHLFAQFCDEITRRGFVCFNGNPFDRATYEAHAPHWWSYQMDTDQNDLITGEYICKKLVGRTADFAGGNEKGKPRKIGLIVESNPANGFRRKTGIERELERRCGFRPAVAVEIAGDDVAQIGSVVAQMRVQGVTTIALTASLLPTLAIFSSADASSYTPEWVMVNSYGLDISTAARLLPPGQTAHLFGMSGWELPRRFQDTDCYRAYKSIDPAGEPDQIFCNLLWISIEHIVNGIQEAGPNLTPETFRDGMYRMPLDPPRAPWAIAGRYGPGDHSFVDSLMEMWWDPAALDPAANMRGAFRFVDDGRRFKPGQLTEDLRVFRDGVTGYQ